MSSPTNDKSPLKKPLRPKEPVGTAEEVLGWGAGPAAGEIRVSGMTLRPPRSGNRADGRKPGDVMGFFSNFNRLPGVWGTPALIVLPGMIDGADLARPGTFPNRLAA